MKLFWVVAAMVTGAAALAAATAHVSSGAAGLFSNDLLTGLMIAVGCALFSAVLRRLPSGEQKL